MHGLVQEFKKREGQTIEVMLRRDLAKHTNIGETKGAIAFRGIARRVLHVALCDLLPKTGELTIYIDRTHTQMTQAGPLTTLVEMAGTVEGTNDHGVISLRSRPIEGRAMRVFIPSYDVLFFSVLETPVITQVAENENINPSILELQGMIDPNRPDALTAKAPFIYVPVVAVAWLQEEVAIRLA